MAEATGGPSAPCDTRNYAIWWMRDAKQHFSFICKQNHTQKNNIAQ